GASLRDYLPRMEHGSNTEVRRTKKFSSFVPIRVSSVFHPWLFADRNLVERVRAGVMDERFAIRGAHAIRADHVDAVLDQRRGRQFDTAAIGRDNGALD